MSAPRNPFPLLPHAHPFLLIDRVVDVGETQATFVKLVTAADPCTAADGTLPPAFVLEVIAQGCGAFLGAHTQSGMQTGYLAGVDAFEVLSEARVGDELRIEIELVRRFAAASLFRGRVQAGDRVVATGRVTLALPT